jgi:hypothetical protein
VRYYEWGTFYVRINLITYWQTPVPRNAFCFATQKHESKATVLYAVRYTDMYITEKCTLFTYALTYSMEHRSF